MRPEVGFVPLKDAKPLRYYVYALKTKEGRVFYIGKGTGARALAHFSKSHSKCVTEVVAKAEGNLSVEFMSWHATSADAEREERRVISTYSFGELLNVRFVKKPQVEKLKAKKPAPCQDEVDRLASAPPLDVLEEILRWWPSFDAVAESVGRFLPDSCRPERRGVYAWLSRGIPRSRQLAFIRAVEGDFRVALSFAFVERITADRMGRLGTGKR